jgi:hypothetical protein
MHLLAHYIFIPFKSIHSRFFVCLSLLALANGKLRTEKFPVQPNMGNTTGNGCSGSLNETCRMGHVLTRLWMVE